MEDIIAPRLDPKEGEALFNSGNRASFVKDFELHADLGLVQHIMPAMIATLLKQDGVIEGVIAPDFGYPLPVMVTYVEGDYIRIFVDPTIKVYKEKGQRQVIVVGLNSLGEGIVFDSGEVPHRHQDWIVDEILHQHTRIELLRSGHSDDVSDTFLEPLSSSG